MTKETKTAIIHDIRDIDEAFESSTNDVANMFWLEIYVIIWVMTKPRRKQNVKYILKIVNVTDDYEIKIVYID